MILPNSAYPNEVVTFTATVFGADGAPIPATLSDATLTIGMASPLACTINGQQMIVTIPVDTELGSVDFTLTWTQVAGGVTASPNPTLTWPVTIIAAPAASAPVLYNVGLINQAVFFVGGNNITVSVVASQNGLVVDPTGTSLQIALTDINIPPVPMDWQSVAWYAETVFGTSTYFATYTASFETGELDVWLQIGTVVVYLGRIEVLA